MYIIPKPKSYASHAASAGKKNWIATPTWGRQMPKPIHLYLLWNTTGRQSGATLLRETALGFAVCGERDVPRDQLTAFVDDTTCAECINRATENPA